MKPLLSILCLCLLACHSVPTPQPAPTGIYHIIEFDAPGHQKDSWTVTRYDETEFPRSITFTTEDGQRITLSGSYEVDEVLSLKARKPRK